jgi:cell division septation protein DedD
MLPASSSAHAAVLDPVAGIAPSMPFGDDAAMTTASTAPAADDVASATPTPATDGIADAPRVGEGFYVQISSQPSEAAARDSLSSLTRRFAGQIGSRGVGIRTAEIPGKGTFYRVRVAAETRDEAVQLCETLKSAGGSCFVTR